MEADDASTPASKPDAYTTAKPSKFTFKSSRRKRSSSKDRDDRPSKRRHRREDKDSRDCDNKKDDHTRHSRRKHRHRSDRHPTSTLDGSYYDPSHRHRESLYDDAANDTSQDAFHESLFDALADDEGAAYWEAVYGQPINIYPPTHPGPTGTLERMTDAEYAEYVRGKMWEKTHQHVVAEREARERARQQQKSARKATDEDMHREDVERESIRRQMEESLRRGEERKKAKEAKAAWDVYTAKWAALDAANNVDTKDLTTLIPWPVTSGSAAHISPEAVERFFRAAPPWKEDSAALLKAERVRWHPDKMSRRFGLAVDEQTVRSVTAVFQVVDAMWSARR